MKRLDKQYGIEFFYEFGKDYYWKKQVEEWGERALSIHAPCVALNLADSKQKNYASFYFHSLQDAGFPLPYAHAFPFQAAAAFAAANQR